MNEKEKAKELIEKFRMYDIMITDLLGDELVGYEETHYKQCVLITIDEMIKQNGELYLKGIAKAYYLEKNHELFELKTEIEKL